MRIIKMFYSYEFTNNSDPKKDEQMLPCCTIQYTIHNLYIRIILHSLMFYSKNMTKIL